jgi:ribokinase
MTGVVVAGAPFLDLVFEGLPRIPAVGHEVVGRGLHLVPGGTAVQAIGLARLGVPVTLVSPRAADPAGRLLAEVLEEERVPWVGPLTDRTPTTAVLCTADGVAMATAPGEGEPEAEEVASAEPELVVLSLGRASLRPAGIPACLVTGSVEIEASIPVPPDADPETDLLVANGTEASALTGLTDPTDAAIALGERVGTAFVTLGADGAIGVRRGQVARADPPPVEAVDATGAGDLFVSAVVWAELGGLALPDALAWACLFAGLSVSAPTALAGARHLDDLLEEGRRRGLSPP